ncbi:CLUMA_CG018303, isoform A [Clunio marinus]|uniref:CLUMA_CG018303, isoform A n=1 Tax=Clunio marinus TaxID=568069 RepID=A0A1J1IXM7_9DIPT|nr:CLUMA_CG018303, isoform A [Clunio marinus]
MKEPPYDEIIVNIESSIQSICQNDKSSVRRLVGKALEAEEKQPKSANNIEKTMKNLREKKCIFTKADKSNEVVILDKQKYLTSMENLLNESQYEKTKFRREFPVDKLQEEVKEMFGIRVQCFRISDTYYVFQNNQNILKILVQLKHSYLSCALT